MIGNIVFHFVFIYFVLLLRVFDQKLIDIKLVKMEKSLSSEIINFLYVLVLKTFRDKTLRRVRIECST